MDRDSNLCAALMRLWEMSAVIHNDQNIGSDRTENGLGHVEQVERNLWRLITESESSTPDEFSNEELFVLSAGACCHDYGKAIKQYKLTDYPPDLSHGEDSAEFLKRNVKFFGLTDKPTLVEYVCELCTIHALLGTEFTNALHAMKGKAATVGKPVGMRRLAVLLKAADVLHTDRSRILQLGVDVSQLKGKHKSKYLARNAIHGWIVNGSEVVIQGAYDTASKRKALEACQKYMTETEWILVQDFLQGLGYPHELKFDMKATGSRYRRHAVTPKAKTSSRAEVKAKPAVASSKAKGDVRTLHGGRIHVTRTRNLPMSAAKDVLSCVVDLSHDSLCRNEYVTHAVGGAICLFACEEVLGTIVSLRSLFENRADELYAEDIYSVAQLQKHILALTNYRIILKQMIPSTDRRTLLARTLRCMPNVRQLLEEDVGALLEEWNAVLGPLNAVLLEVTDYIGRKYPSAELAVWHDSKRYSRKIAPAVRNAAKELRELRDKATGITERLNDFCSELRADWHNDYMDIQLEDEGCRQD